MSQSFPTDSQGNDFVPKYSFTKTNAPKTRVVSFGDGFEQRITFGINQNPKTFNLTFVPGESSMSFVCLQWRKQIPYLNRSTITATFRQVFEP